MDERKISMLAIRYLCQVAEAISIQIMNHAPGATKMVEICVHCSDRAEHIAQYDVEGLDIESRMHGIAGSLKWLTLVVRQHGDMLEASNHYVPSIADLDRVWSAASVQRA